VAEARDVDPEWLSSMSRWLREAQGLMSNMASNYNMLYLFAGVGLAFLGACLASGSVFLIHKQQTGLLSLMLVTVPYGIMMFASSFVEEEQHYWYWTTSLWLAYLGSREIRA
jgi:ethanolaminephosphotransferase